MTKAEKIKYLLAPTIGFGIGGALWGWLCFSVMGKVGGSEIPVPYFFIPGIIPVGILGSLSLVWFLKNKIKKILAIFGGIFVWIVGSLVALFGFLLFLGGGVALYSLVREILDFAAKIRLLSLDNAEALYWGLDGLQGLEPGSAIGLFWLAFLIIGMILALFYALVLKTKKWPLVWRGGAGFALASVISPIFGNLIGNGIFNLLVSAYIITFTLIGIILGLSLGWGVHRGQKFKEVGGQEKKPRT